MTPTSKDAVLRMQIIKHRQLYIHYLYYINITLHKVTFNKPTLETFFFWNAIIVCALHYCTIFLNINFSSTLL